MELSDLLLKEKEIYSKIEQSIKEQQRLHEELKKLYETAKKEGFVWQSTDKVWYRE